MGFPSLGPIPCRAVLRPRHQHVREIKYGVEMYFNLFRNREITKLLWLALIALLSCNPGYSSDFNFSNIKIKHKTEVKPQNPRLESTLSRLVSIYKNQDYQSLLYYAKSHFINLKDRRVLVELILKENHLAEDITPSINDQFDAEIDRSSDRLILLWIPIEQLHALSYSLESVVLIHRPFKFQPDILSEGVQLIRATQFHADNVYGEGVKIGIIDIGFGGINVAREANEVPAGFHFVNYTDEEMNQGNIHGTACTEIIYDIAPEAEYYLSKILNLADFGDAVDDMIDEEVDIISHSCGLIIPVYSYYSESDYANNIVTTAQQRGILFVNSAGNYARRHYRAVFDDLDQEDNYHRFADGVPVNIFVNSEDDTVSIDEGMEIVISLAWDDYPRSAEDYDLYLVKWNSDAEEWETADESVNEQRGEEIPYEYIDFEVETPGIYGIVVHNNDAEDGIDFTIFTNRDLAYRTPEGSIIIPANAQYALAVGAINQLVWREDEVEIETFSSHGPTYDGVLKPNICGPDGVSSLTYGNQGFRGTSASCPHIAGAAALLLCQNQERTNNDLRSLLLRTAEDAGEEGADNIFGYGQINLLGEPLPNRLINVPDDFETIQAAIDASFNGDTVLVQPGTYIENIDFKGHEIILGSLFLITGDTAYIDSTIIDGDENGSVVTFEGGENNNAVLIGFTITNGNGKPMGGFHSRRYGGGIYCYRSNPTISYCNITGNAALGEISEGGGIYSLGSDLRINNVKIESNEGDGIYCGSTCSPVLINSIIIQNIGYGYECRNADAIFESCLIDGNLGSGIRCREGENIFNNCQITNNEGSGVFGRQHAVIELNNCTISHNNKGIHLLGSQAIARSVLINNNSEHSAYLWSGSTLGMINSTIACNEFSLHLRDFNQLELINCILWDHSISNSGGNISISYCDIEGGINGITDNGGEINWGEGNINSNPRFENPDEGDFNLQPNSPCIDAGDPELLDRDSTRSDMGAFPHLYFERLQGFVLDAMDNRPLEGALVHINNRNPIETDANGFFRFFDFKASPNFNLTACKEGYNDSTITHLCLERDDTLEVTFCLVHPRFSVVPNEISLSMMEGVTEEINITITNIGNGSGEWMLEPRSARGEVPWTLRSSIPIGEIVRDWKIQGVAFIENCFYVSGASVRLCEDNPNMIYVLNREGQLIDSFLQPDTLHGYYGMHDLAWDGELIWGSGERKIIGMTTEGEIQRIFDGPYNANIALTWDPDREVFWVASIVDGIDAINQNGDCVDIIQNWDLHIYGLAYRHDDPDDCPLYVSHELPNGGSQISKINPDNDTIMLVKNLQEIVEGSAGGNFITDNYDDSNWFYLCIANNGAADRIDIWYIDGKLGWMNIEPENGLLAPGVENISYLTICTTGLEERVYQNSLIFKYFVPLDSILIPVILSISENPVDNETLLLPLSFAITGVYPNPFNSTTTIHYELPQPSHVSLLVYDLAGRLVERLVDERVDAGRYTKSWYAGMLPSGVYFVRFEAGDMMQMRKVVLIR